MGSIVARAQNEDANSAKAKLNNNIGTYVAAMWGWNVVSIFLSPIVGGTCAYLHGLSMKVKEWPWDVPGAVDYQINERLNTQCLFLRLVAAIISLFWLVIFIILIIFVIGIVLVVLLLIGLLLFVLAVDSPRKHALQFSSQGTVVVLQHT